MPSTDTKPELTAKASMAQPISQPAVYANGLNHAGLYKNKQLLLCQKILCSVDRASLNNLVNETHLVHNILSIFCQFYL
jgi:hypothetical protein